MDIQGLDALRSGGQMQWSHDGRGWEAEPDEVVSALSGDGFAEYKREIARNPRDRHPIGGVWQGLNTRTGAVASAVWVRPAPDARALIYIEIDGQPIQGEA